MSSAGERFDHDEAERLARDALALTEELLDPDREIRALDDLHRRAYRRSRDLSAFHAKMIRLWEYLADAQRRGDLVVVRSAVAAVEREVRKEFRRREGAME